MHMTDLTERVRRALQAAGAARSAELQQVCNASQASISRALAPLLAAGEVLKVGRARNQAYVMPRRVDGASTTGTVPIMKVDAKGKVFEFGTLIPVVRGRCWVEEFEAPEARLHDGLPWFLADMRPQGFLGRAFAHARKDLRLADNPDHWTDDDVLKALCQAGEDLPGNLILGAKSFERLMHAGPGDRVPPERYAELAEAAMHGALPGSSAGGEHPKFCTVRDDGQPVIVKFSPSGNSAPERRWADLLLCEHLALALLDETGVPAAKTRIFMDGGRTLLEVERFDRTPRGRIGMVSLLAFDNEYIGQIDNWAASAERMSTRGLMRPDDAHRLRLLEAYGQLIGNTDRHYGNISLLIDASGNWALAPAYDTLPMVYAPVAGELVSRDEFDPGKLAPTADTLRVWDEALQLAISFWRSVTREKRISSAFRETAKRHARSLEASAGAQPPAAEEPVFQRARPS
ncbi:type II toxin-antitoxin system HipA family toxin YjjJ [Variovorax paradoxus]|nr:type II toxin-antitoxin system HipA family toxin YjjJ [Variovorax paradoxus]